LADAVVGFGQTFVGIIRRLTGESDLMRDAGLEPDQFEALAREAESLLIRWLTGERLHVERSRRADDLSEQVMGLYYLLHSRLESARRSADLIEDGLHLVGRGAEPAAVRDFLESAPKLSGSLAASSTISEPTETALSCACSYSAGSDGGG
jgi:hypothetical protein